MPANYFVNEGDKICSTDASALGTSVKQIAAGAAIEKGQPLMMADAFSVSPSDGTKPCVGFAENAAAAATATVAAEKVVVLTEGFIKMDVDAVGISAGDIVMVDANGKAAVLAAGGFGVGYAVSDGEANGVVYVKILLMPYAYHGAVAVATGAEVDTGADNAKYVTAKALKDSGYLGTAAANVAALAGTETDADICTKVNAILTALKTAGVMAADAEEGE
jgi:hypothetical protein